MAVDFYRLFRDGTLIATTSSTTLVFTDTGLTGSTSYSYALAAVDTSGNVSGTSTLSQTTLPANNAPTDITIDGANNDNFAENQAGSTTVGVLATVDPDGGDTHTYSFCGGADDGKFSITGSNLIANPAFDFETPVDANTDNVYSICIRTTDNGTGNLTYDETITVTVTDVDDTVPTTPTLATTSVAVTTIGLSWSTSTDNVAVDFYRLFRDGTLIATTSSTTLVFTDTGLTGSTSYSYALAAVDTSGNVSGTSTLSQTTLPANNAPTDITIDGANNDNFAENQAGSTTVGVLATVDPDGGDTHTYSFCGGADDGKFSITGSNLIANPAFDFESPVDANTDNVYSICIRTTDNGTGNLTYDETITVTVTDVDDTVPTTPTLATTSVAVTTIGLSWSTSTDNVAVDFYRLFRDGTLIATTSSTTLVFTDTGLTGSTSYSYALAAVDTSGNVSGTSTLSQTTLPANNAPTDITIDGANNDNFAENQAGSTTVGVLATVDPDGGDTHTYSFCGGADDGKFSITGSNLIANPAFDFESPVDANTDNVYSICIRTTDNGTGNLTYDETITVTVTDVDDTVPTTPTLATTSVAVTTIGLSWSTSTDNVAVDFYRLFRDGTLIATTSSTTTLVFTDTGLTGSTSYSYALAAVDTSGNVSGTSTLSQTTLPANNAPTDITIDGANNDNFAENQAGSTTVGVLATVDPDGGDTPYL